MNNVKNTNLSAAGVAKRDAILQDAMSAMAKHHRARRRKRVAIASAAMIAIVCGGAIVINQIAATTTARPAQNIVKGPLFVNEQLEKIASEYDSPAVQWRIVRSDSSAVDQYKVHTASLVERIDNAELAQALNAINRPAGVITIDGQVRLTQNVVDEKTALDEGAPSSM